MPLLDSKRTFRIRSLMKRSSGRWTSSLLTSMPVCAMGFILISARLLKRRSISPCVVRRLMSRSRKECAGKAPWSCWKSETRTRIHHKKHKADTQNIKCGLCFICLLCDFCGEFFSSDSRQAESRLASHVLNEPVGLARAAPFIEQVVRLTPRHLENLLIPHDVGDAKCRDA
jgi:hypothetical protein